MRKENGVLCKGCDLKFLTNKLLLGYTKDEMGNRFRIQSEEAGS